MVFPKLAMCNFLTDVKELKEFALYHQLDGIDWTIKIEDLPGTKAEEALLVRDLSVLKPLEVRYHLYFRHTDLGHTDPYEAEKALRIFRHSCRIISQLGGRFITIHVGLGRDSMEGICWENTLTGLANLAQSAKSMGIRICLENLASGWTSRPNLFEKLLRKTGCWGTLDLGHALVCKSVQSEVYHIEDFALPHAARFLNAHVYHQETPWGHVPPARIHDLEPRLQLLERLPLCNWWVLELRDERATLDTLRFVREFLQ